MGSKRLRPVFKIKRASVGVISGRRVTLYLSLSCVKYIFNKDPLESCTCTYFKVVHLLGDFLPSFSFVKLFEFQNWSVIFLNPIILIPRSDLYQQTYLESKSSGNFFKLAKQPVFHSHVSWKEISSSNNGLGFNYT